MCLVRVRANHDDDDEYQIRRVRRPASRSEIRVAYSPRASTRETRTRVSQAYIVESPRPIYNTIDDPPRAQYLAGPPQYIGPSGVQIHQSAPLGYEGTPPAPPPAPAPKMHHHHPSLVETTMKEKEKEVIYGDKAERKAEKKIEEKTEKVSPHRGAESKSRLEVVSVEHSDPRPSHSTTSRTNHSRHGSKASESARGSERRGDYDRVIVERERSIHTKRYPLEPARQSEPQYDTYRYVEAPLVKRAVRRLEDKPRRSTGGLFEERERERERLVLATGGSRRRRDLFK